MDDTGRIVKEVKVASEPAALLKVLGNPTYRFKRIGLEAGPLSQWLFSVLAEGGDRTRTPFAAAHEFARVQVFGRRHEEAIHALRRPASEKRQCTKSRECGTRQCSECYGDRMLVAISMVDAARAECLHNFRVLA